MANLKTLKPFTKERPPSKAAIAKRAATNRERSKKRRELTDLLSLALKGKIGNDINKVLSDLGVKATTIEEALHFVQIAKAISKEDTQAYQALMQTSGLNKPVKTETDVTMGIIWKEEKTYEK